MASVTPSSSSSAPSSTDNPDTPFFASGASPPLIIGFIAIGTFMLGIITICAWKRITGRDLLLQRSNALAELEEGRRKKGDGFGEKPELFDVWYEEPRTGDVRWENVMPFSATVIPESPHSKVPCKLSKDTHAQQSKGEKDDHSAREGRTHHPNASLQIAVMLAMPSPHPIPHPTQEGENTETSAGSSSDCPEVTEYSIGLFEVPWEREEGDPDIQSGKKRGNAGGFVYC